MESKTEPLEELADAMNESFGSGVLIGAVLGATIGVALTVTTSKLTDMWLVRQKSKETKRNIKAVKEKD